MIKQLKKPEKGEKYAIIKTNMGTISAKLFEKEHPHIAAAFYDMRFDLGGEKPKK